MTTRALNEAAQRLKLPAPSQMSAAELVEAQTCTGCRARYQRGARVVDARADCPAHGGALR
jgi:hypothetical protein